MHPKTAFGLLTAILLSINLSISYGQDSTKTRLRVPATANSVNPTDFQASPQQQSVGVSTDKSINGQYQFILSKVYRYQQPMVSAFYKSVQDTLRTQKTTLTSIQLKLAEQTKNLASLQADVNSKQDNLNHINSQIDSISFLGMPVSKASYNIMMWGLVIVLGGLAAAVIFLSSSARREAHYRTKLYNELEEEYKGYKTKANDKEKKLSRDLQTVRNKLEEITGNPEY